jgi:Protein of unknown function (DUF3052)
VRLFHWRAEEAKPLIAALRAEGYTVDYPGDKANGDWRTLRKSPPLAAVIDLTRLPSHGRWVAAEIRATKSLRHIPIVFVDGEPAKVEVIRKMMPDAIYTSRARLASALKKSKPLADPVVPPRLMNRTDRTAAEKLGITAGARVALLDPPPDYLRVLGKLPADVAFEEEADGTASLTLWFVRDADTYLAGIDAMRKRAAYSRIWVIYPKRQPGGAASAITQGYIRETALSVGLVDYKVCSVNEVWTGLLFTRKR